MDCFPSQEENRLLKADSADSLVFLSY